MNLKIVDAEGIVYETVAYSSYDENSTLNGREVFVVIFSFVLGSSPSNVYVQLNRDDAEYKLEVWLPM